jgi:hypothetical protein
MGDRAFDYLDLDNGDVDDGSGSNALFFGLVPYSTVYILRVHFWYGIYTGLFIVP